jgi:hypothetical protein
VIVHPGYVYYFERNMVEYDIGLLELSAPIDELFSTGYVMPACLPTNPRKVIFRQ